MCDSQILTTYVILSILEILMTKKYFSILWRLHKVFTRGCPGSSPKLQFLSPFASADHLFLSLLHFAQYEKQKQLHSAQKKTAALCTFSFPVGGPVQRAHWVAAVKVWGSSFIQVGISPGSRWEDSISPGFWLLVTRSPGKMVTWSLSWLILAAVSPGYLVYHGNLVSGLRSCHSPPSPSHLWSLCSLEKPSPLLTTLSRAPFRGPQSEYRQQYVPCTATRFCTIIEQRMHEKQLHAVQRK